MRPRPEGALVGQQRRHRRRQALPGEGRAAAGPVAPAAGPRPGPRSPPARWNRWRRRAGRRARARAALRRSAPAAWRRRRRRSAAVRRQRTSGSRRSVPKPGAGRIDQQRVDGTGRTAGASRRSGRSGCARRTRGQALRPAARRDGRACHWRGAGHPAAATAASPGSCRPEPHRRPARDHARPCPRPRRPLRTLRPAHTRNQPADAAAHRARSPARSRRARIASACPRRRRIVADRGSRIADRRLPTPDPDSRSAIRGQWPHRHVGGRVVVSHPRFGGLEAEAIQPALDEPGGMRVRDGEPRQRLRSPAGIVHGHARCLGQHRRSLAHDATEHRVDHAGRASRRATLDDLHGVVDHRRRRESAWHAATGTARAGASRAHPDRGPPVVASSAREWRSRARASSAGRRSPTRSAALDRARRRARGVPAPGRSPDPSGPHPRPRAPRWPHAGPARSWRDARAQRRFGTPAEPPLPRRHHALAFRLHPHDAQASCPVRTQRRWRRRRGPRRRPVRRRLPDARRLSPRAPPGVAHRRT